MIGRRPAPESVPPRPRILRLLLAATLAVSGVPALADPTPRDAMDAAEIRLALEKLSVTGSALYIGAHPDDENTAFLAWLTSGRKVRAIACMVSSQCFVGGQRRKRRRPRLVPHRNRC